MFEEFNNQILQNIAAVMPVQEDAEKTCKTVWLLKEYFFLAIYE